MSLRGYRDVPYPLDTPEWASFKNYAKAYYKDVVLLSVEVFDSLKDTPLPCAKEEANVILGSALASFLNATVSPLVYLWEKWQIMSLDAKLKYATPEYKEQLERVKAESQKIKEKAGTATPTP